MSKPSKLSKIIFAAAIGATAITSLAGAASADERDATLRANLATIDVDGGGEAEGSGFTLESNGRYDSGFQYDATVMNLGLDSVDDVDIDRVDSTAFELNARYMFGNVGPAATYIYEDAYGEDVFGLGIAGEYEAGQVLGYASFVSDVEDFGDTYRLTLGGKAYVAEGASLRAEYQRTTLDYGLNLAEDTIQTIEVGGRYDIFDNIYVDANVVHPLEMGDIDANVFGLGVGLAF